MKPFGSDDNKILTKFSVKTKNGNILKLCIMVLPNGRHEEFVDLFMKNFVPCEKTHIATGMLDSNEALDEYRKVLSKYFKNESLQKIICCQDSDDGTAFEIFGGSVLKLYRKCDSNDCFLKAKMEPVKKFINIHKKLDVLVSDADLMAKYNVDRYYELMWAFVRNDMRQVGILKEFFEASLLICEMHGVPLLGAWCTSVGSQKLSDSIGSELVYEISYKDLGQLVGATFEDDPPSIKFMVKRNFKKSNL